MNHYVVKDLFPSSRGSIAAVAEKIASLVMFAAIDSVRLLA